MKLTEFNPEVVPTNNRSQLPKIGFQSSGLITLNKSAVELLKLKVGDTVKLYQSQEDTADWYVAKAKGGFPIRALSANGYLGFSCSFLRDKVFASVGYEKKSASAPIKADALVKVDGTNTAYLILTMAIKKPTKSK